MKKNSIRLSKISKTYRKYDAIAVFCCLCLLTRVYSVQGYSQVVYSNSNANNEGPKIFKALNMDLIYPRTFNSSENLISTTQTPLSAATATATTAIKVPTPSNSMASKPTLINHEQQQQESEILYVTPANDVHQVDAAAEAFGAIDSDPAPTQTAENAQQQQQQERQPIQEAELLENASTGRAVDYQSANAYNLNQFITPLIKNSARPVRPPAARPIYTRPLTQTHSSSTGLGKIIYPQVYQTPKRQPPNRAEIYKLQGKAPFSDRFTPGEATAAGTFAHQHHKHYHPPSGNGNGNKLAAPSKIVQSYTPPKNIYAFPPNINAHYPPPAKDPKAALPSSSVNSYVAPPSGPLSSAAGFPLIASASDTKGYKYAGPVSPEYLPPKGGPDDDKAADAPKGADSDDDDGDNDDTIGVLPASAMDSDMDGKGAATEAPNMGDMDSSMKDAGGDDEHDHPPADDDKEYPTPPPGWVEEHPESAHDHPHDFHHDHPIITDHDHGHHFDHFSIPDHFPSYPHYHDHYPEIIYDDHHDHHHHVTHPPPTLPPVTTELPPEPAPEPRVKKYSYFYIGRKLWYIPLYFTVWFSFYVLWLILKSIARHKVNLPNHYVNRRSLPDYSDEKAHEYINQLTVSVLKKIDDYGRQLKNT